MKVLDPSRHTPTEIDEQGTQKLEAFLDRNYPGWRDRELHKATRAATIQREWLLGADEMEFQRDWVPGMQDFERVARYRGEYVEIEDRCFRMDETEEVYIHPSNHRLCAIDGDLTPVAVWGKRGS